MMSGQQLPPPPEPRPAVRYSRPVETGQTVCVACKLPGGVLLRVFEPYTRMDPQQDGTAKPVKEWRAIPDLKFSVKGPWVASAGQAFMPQNSAVAQLLPGGFAITYGVPKDLWDRWLDQNKETNLVRKGIIFAAPSMMAATEEAKKARDVKSGLEPVDPNNPATRMPGGVDRRLRVSILQEGGEDTSPRY
jgi:hypothetical protein